MKKCLLVSDSFKGTLSSKKICDIAAEVFSEQFPRWELKCIPVADGGEGTVDCFLYALNAEPVSVTVRGVFGEDTEARYARFGNKAVIEMAAAAGLPLAAGRENPAAASTYGVGQLIAHAVKNGCSEILLGLGGSATNDGGCGCAAALGTVFTDKEGKSFVPTGSGLSDIAHIDISATAEMLKNVRLSAMCDVTNPLYGENGAAFIFAPQKGADEKMVKLLDAGLINLAAVIESDLGLSISDIPGSGAAGGMGAGCMAFLGAELRSGIDAVLDISGFDALLEDADLVITGEGRIDSQSAGGKLISGIARRCRAAGVPLAAIAGCIDDSAAAAYDIGVRAMFSTNRSGLPFEKLAPRAAEDYRRTLTDFMRTVDLLNS